MCISRLYRDGFSGGTEVAALLPLTPMLLLPQSVLPLLQEKKFSSYSMLSVPHVLANHFTGQSDVHVAGLLGK